MRKVYAMRELDSGAARGISTTIDKSIPRAAGIPSKRSTTFDREASRNGKHNHITAGNGKYNRDAVEQEAREAIQSSYRSKSPQFRTFKGEAIDVGFYSGLGCYKIAILVIAVCFLTITVMQGSVMLIVKHTDFLTIPSSDTSWIPPGAEDMLDCERAVKSAVDIFTERLPLKASDVELWKMERDSRRPPRLALICPSLEEVPDSLHLSTVARGLQWLGYGLELYGHQDGPLRPAWEDIGVPVHIVQDDWKNITVDWSNFEGVLAVSLDAKKILESVEEFEEYSGVNSWTLLPRQVDAVLTSLAQEPFTDVPLFWIINENIILDQDIEWNASAELLAVYYSWLETFNRSTVLVFPNYFLPLEYKDFYIENFYVIPGSPRDVWEAEQYMLTHTREDVRAKVGFGSDDFVIVVVGSPCTSKKVWREHAIILKAIANLTPSFSSKPDASSRQFRLLILGHGNSTSNDEHALQMMAQHVGLRDGVVKLVGVEFDIHEVLWLADTVVYGSIWEELSFPPVLIRAMSLERPVVVPNLGAISKQVVDCKSAFLFPGGDDQALGQVLLMVTSNPVLVQNVALEGASLARNLLAREAVVEYGYLLEKVLDFPWEGQFPRPMVGMLEVIPTGWRWEFFMEPVLAADNSTVKDLHYLQSATDLRFVGNASGQDSGREDLETFVDEIDWLNEKDWTQEKQAEETDTWEQLEDEMMKDRLGRIDTSFEEVNKMAKKTETRVAQDKHLDINHFEIERVAQPLCIYEPYYGSGSWPFLHRDHLLYQGLSLSSDGRRPHLDDVDGASRLRLLNSSYYRDVLCEVAGIFAIAKLIDRVHRNSWIGFQPWRAVSRKLALKLPAEAALLAAVSTERHGDALYFWAQLESNEFQPSDDFWTSCDFANAGNCRTVFDDTFRKMYGLPSNWTQLPSLPTDGGTWSAMHCWAMPTTSFLEFVMFASLSLGHAKDIDMGRGNMFVNVRMFVNALDAVQYEDHHDKGRCCFKVARIEVKHCYCNFLEGLVNVWAYHSARGMIYLDPETGLMHEQHDLEQRRGKMLVKWFRRSLLKSMDEDLAEAADEELPDKRWLWPDTGEVYWEGTREKERRERFEAKVEKKRRQLEKQARQSKYKQRAIGGKYVKPLKVAKQKKL